MLLWHLCHSALPVGTSLQLKIPNFDPSCARCLSRCEDHLYLFRDCHYSKAFWAHVFQCFTPPNPPFLVSFYSSNWIDWISLNLGSPPSWSIVFGMVVWHLWKIRNNAVFRKCSFHHSTNFNNFMFDVTMNGICWQDKGKNIQGTPPKQNWIPPPGGIKLNTDGSYKDISHASGGGAFRKDNGAWLKGFSVKFRVRKPVEAELLAMRFGLEMAKDMGLNGFQLEVDAKAILTMLNGIDKNISHELGAILYEVSSLIKDLKVEVSYIHRDANNLAHFLSRYGLGLTQDIQIHEAVPEFAMRAFNHDFQGPQIETVDLNCHETIQF